MSNITVAVLGSQEYSRGIGKAGTATDITFYNLKRGDDTVTMIEPSRYPERIQSLFFAVSMADMAILVVDEITPVFGETVVMLNAVGIRKGYLILRNYLERSSLAPLIKGTVLEGYACINDDAVALRELLLRDAASWVHNVGSARAGVVPIDHHFNVKGIGTVILGTVTVGSIHRHDTLTVMPGTMTTQIRSIQKHDDDCDSATAGDRVGLALKNIDAEDLDRGYVLTNDPRIRMTETIEGRADLGDFWKTPLYAGMVLHIGHWMQFVTARVERVDQGSDAKHPNVQIVLDKPLVYLPGDRAVVHHLDAGKLRVAGTIDLLV
ncbi:MAG: elongation factor Tu [Methanomicrobiales archaeon]|nr:elongation factor Tu [Methanomicrobiales archaeon]